MYLDTLISDIPGKPFWYPRSLNDVNPQSRTVKADRSIWIPNQTARKVQKALASYLIDALGDRVSPYSTACMPGCSPLLNAVAHLKSRHFYLTDLTHAYQSVTPCMVAQTLCKLDPRLSGEDTAVLAFLEQYCFLHPAAIPAGRKPQAGLITGGPASPLLFNLVAEQVLDLPISAILAETGIVYTRYLDDLSFSGPEQIPDEIKKAIRAVIIGAGFLVNHWKSQVLDIYKSGSVRITGIQIVHPPGKSPYTKVPPRYLEKISNMIYLASKPDSRIAPAEVHGLWGSFCSCIQKRPYTSSERKVVDAYQHFCQLQRHPRLR